MLCLYFGTKCHFFTIDLVVAFVLFILAFTYVCTAVFLCRCRFSVKIKIYNISHVLDMTHLVGLDCETHH